MPDIQKRLTDADFRMLFEQSPDIDLVLSPDFTILGANDLRLQATMSTLEGTVGRNVFDAFPDNPNDPEATGVRNLRASLERVVRTKTADEMPVQKYDLQRPPERGGGWEERYWKPTNTPVLRADGSIAYILHRVEDVTELTRLRQAEALAEEREAAARRQAEESAMRLAREEAARAEAEAAQEKIATILESITDGFIALDAELRYTYVNRRAEDFLGRPRHEIIGKRVDATFPTLVGSESEASLLQALRGQTLQRYETASTVGGHWLEVHVYPSRDGLSVYFRDIEDKRRAEEALRESESRYRTLFDSSLDGIILASQDGGVLAMNDAACRKVACSAEMPRSSLNVFDFIDRSDPRVAAALKGPGQSSGFRGEIAVRRVDETMFEAEASIVSFCGEKGTDQLGVFVRDITERKRTEAMRARLAAILESTPDFVGSFDIQGRGLMLNQSARRMLGIPEREEVTALGLAQLYPSEMAHRVLTEGIPVALRDGVWRGETAILTREGHRHPVSQVLLAHRDASGQVASFSTVMRDIAALKRTEELQKFLSEASRTLVGSLEYESTLESVVRIVVPKLADFCIVYVLEGDTLRTRAIAHAAPSQERHLEELRHSVPPHDAVVGVRGVLRTGEPELVPEITPAWLWAASPESERFRILSELGPRSCMILPLVARGTTLGALALYSSREGWAYTQAELVLAQGVADRAAFAIQNARLYQESQQATRLRDEVLGVVSHDLRNPVSTILLAVQQLRSELAAEETKRSIRKVEIIQRSAERANTLINDLLDVARMRAGQLTASPSATGARALLVESFELHHPLAEEKSLRLELEGEEDLPEVLADHARVMQVLANLIGNAIKFTPSGGRIALEADQVGSEVVFSITDSGPGIPPDLVPKLFDPFWQATRGSRSGAGLGLAIARGILDAHGGRIWVESDENQGSTFRFSLPVARAEGQISAELHH